MKVDKERASEYLEEKCKELAFNKKINTICENLYDKYNIPLELSSDILAMRRKAIEYSDFVLYAIISEIDSSKRMLEKFFTDVEIRMYQNGKMEEKKLEFPIVFDAIEIADDQWISRITLKQIIELRDAGLTNYNPNAQRALRQYTKKGVVLMKIDTNPKQIREIAESMRREDYIPDIITFNIPFESDADFYYSNGKLVINRLEHFDMTDGYHRICAMAQINAEDENFDYPMELRITNFAESKAQHFIYQMDQKTKMKKVNSDSFDQSSVANMIVKKLRDTAMKEYIGRENEVLDIGLLASYINYFYGTVPKNQNTQTYVRKIVMELKGKFEVLMDSHVELEQERWTEMEIAAAIFAFNKTETLDEIPEKFDAIMACMNQLSTEKKLNKLMHTQLKRQYINLEKQIDAMLGV